MIKLLMGITLSESGGSQRVVYDIIAGLPEDQYEITLLTSPGGDLINWIEALNRTRMSKVRVIAVPSLKRDVSPAADAAAFVRMLAAQTGAGYDIAHFHNSKMGILGRLSARLAGVPRVYYTVHGWGLNRANAGLLYGPMSLMERAAAKLTHGIVFVSAADMAAGIRHGWAAEARSRLIYNGVSVRRGARAGIRRSLGIPDGVPVAAFVARLAEPKDPMFAIRVSARVSAMGVDHRMLIVGDGPMRAECARLIMERGAGGTVLLLGHRDDVPAILEESDAFCLFTKWEGLPVSVIEAMHAGLPVLASAVGGVPELVQHGVTGFLLESLDEQHAAGMLAELMTDRALSERMGQASREAARTRFTLEGMVSGYRQLYEQGGAHGGKAWSRR